MKRGILLMATMTLTVLLATGVALAAEIQCTGGADCFGTNQADTLTGTAAVDKIYGLGGPDLIFGLAGGDSLFGGSGGDEIRGAADGDIIVGAGDGDDTVFGGPGVDFIGVAGDQQYGFQDEVFCTEGDLVEADDNDILHNCVMS